MGYKKVIILVLVIAAVAFAFQASLAFAGGGGNLQGTVKDAINNSPIGGATLTLTQGATTIGTDTSDAAGGYSIPLPAAGTYSLTASAAGYVPATYSVSVVAAGATIQNVELGPLPNNVVPEVPWGTVAASLAMAFGLAGYLVIPKFKKRT